MWIGLADAPVNFCRRSSSHFIGDMGVDVQRGTARYMPNHRGEGLDVHPMLQRHGGEQVAEIMEADVFAPCPLQNGGQVFADRGGV